MKTRYNSKISAADAKVRERMRNSTGAIRFHRSLRASLCALLLAWFIALSPSPAQALCNQWDVSGQWVLHQDNGYTLTMNVRQNGDTLLGEASFPYQAKTDGGIIGGAFDKINPLPKGVLPDAGSKEGRINRGVISGSLKGNVFYMQITWHPSMSVGVYNGRINAFNLRGTTYDLNVQSNKSTWSRTSPVKCGDAPGTQVKPPSGLGLPPPPRPTPPVEHTPAFVPITKLKVRPPDAASVPPTAPAPPLEAKASGAPSIRANPANIKVSLGQMSGSTTIVWDGGADHPYAEIWVGVNGQDPTFVVEQGKGSRRVTVELGKTYRYILTDSGKELATVTIRAN